MILTIPDGLIISDVSVTNDYRTYTSESISAKVQSRDTGVQQFSGTLTLTAEDQNEFAGARLLNGFVMGLKGRLNQFEIKLGGAFAVDPSSLTFGTNPVLSVTHGVGRTKLAVANTNTINRLYAGTYFTFANDTKMHVLLGDITSSASVDMVPAVRVHHNTSDAINVIDPHFTVILDSNETITNHNSGGLIVSVTLNWEEFLGVIV